jgi:hypothetical protein
MPKQTSGMCTDSEERLHLARLEQVVMIDRRRCRGPGDAGQT